MFFKGRTEKGAKASNSNGVAAAIPDAQGAKSGTRSITAKARPTADAVAASENVQSPTSDADAQALRLQATTSKQVSAAIGDCMRVLMRTPTHRHLSLAELEPLVLPAVMTKQFAIAEMKPDAGGATVPVGVVIWASVSKEVDARLSADLSAPIRLQPEEWQSGDIIWLLEATGDARIVGDLLSRLVQNRLGGRPMKTRTKGADGCPSVAVLGGNGGGVSVDA